MILDGHIHLTDDAPETGPLLAELAAAGISGAALISQRPASFVGGGQPPAARLQHVLDWCVPGTNLYPLFWVDPLEPDALDQVALAVARGIAGFKVICNHFHPGHPAALRTFRAIADAGHRSSSTPASCGMAGRRPSSAGRPVSRRCSTCPACVSPSRTSAGRGATS